MLFAAFDFNVAHVFAAQKSRYLFAVQPADVSVRHHGDFAAFAEFVYSRRQIVYFAFADDHIVRSAGVYPYFFHISC